MTETIQTGRMLAMTAVTLSATPRGNGYQATLTYPDQVSISSTETYSSVTEAISAAAIKLLDMPDRLEGLVEQMAG
jgi:hypothetical protein